MSPLTVLLATAACAGIAAIVFVVLSGRSGRRSEDPARPTVHAAVEDPRPAIDWSVINSLAEFQVPGADDIVIEVVDTYRRSIFGYRENLCGTVHQGTVAAVELAAHSLKSSSAQVGAVRLGELCQQLEQQCMDGDLDEAGKLTPQVDREIGRVLAALESLSEESRQ